MVRPDEERFFEPPKLIDLNDEAQVRYWVARFGATPEELRQAVTEVGNNAVAVSIWMREPIERPVCNPASDLSVT